MCPNCVDFMKCFCACKCLELRLVKPTSLASWFRVKVWLLGFKVQVHHEGDTIYWYMGYFERYQWVY
jgi:hypothetical protein